MRKIGLICLALVMALGSIGVAYAAWTDTLAISGTVTTGSVALEFANAELHDDDRPSNPGGDYPTDKPDYTSNDGFVHEPEKGFFWPLDKNVGWGEVVLVDTTGDDRNDTLTVTLKNTYPSYFNELTFYVHNYGTLPLRIDHVLINGIKITSPGILVRYDFNEDDLDDFEIIYGDNFGAQIHPSGGAGFEFSFWMHVLQPCPQDLLDEAHFTIEVVAVQWNEYPYSP